MRHPIIAIEGIDGSGKATNAKWLVEWLKTQGLNAVYRNFPRYENTTGTAILSHLKKEWQVAELESGMLLARKSPLDELIFQCMMTLNRYEAADDLLEAVERGPVVLDRYYASGLVYGTANGVSSEFLERLHAFLPHPDIWILIDIPVSVSFQRRPERRDRYEKQEGMLERVRWLFLELFEKKKWHIVNGVGTPEEVQRRVRDCIPKSMFM